MTDDKSGWQRMVGRLRNLLGGAEADEPSLEPEKPVVDNASPTVEPMEPTYTAVEQKWRDAMPVCLLDHFAPMMRNLDTLDFMSIRLALHEEYAQPADQALVLFAWYGQGAGSWKTGDYPLYETVPEQLLMELPLAALVGALQDNPLDPAHLEGAARFFSGDLFLGMRGGEVAQLPPDITAALLAHVRETASDNETKIAQVAQLTSS